jgi:cell division control protein 6
MNAYMHVDQHQWVTEWGICADPAHIQSVKAALHLSTVPDVMICRDVEQGKVFEYCKDQLLRGCPGSLYVCGCPGTGKSMLMEKVKVLASKWADEVQNWMIVFLRS